MRAGATTPACVLERGEKGREESKEAPADTESATITTAANATLLNAEDIALVRDCICFT